MSAQVVWDGRPRPSAPPCGCSCDGGGPRPALALIDALVDAGDLDNYHLLHACRADLLRRIGSLAEAAQSYRRALTLVSNESERRFLERRLTEMAPSAARS